jgi:hypothetical protein
MPALGIVLGWICVIDGNRNLLQAGPQDLFGNGFIHEPAVCNENWEVIGFIEGSNHPIEILADEWLTSAEGDDHGTQTVELFADLMDLLHRQLIGGIGRLLPEVANLTMKIAAVSHLQIAME